MIFYQYGTNICLSYVFLTSSYDTDLVSGEGWLHQSISLTCSFTWWLW